MEEVKRTQEEEQELLEKGKAIRCPNCDGILTNVKKACPNCGYSDTSQFEKAAKQRGLLTSFDGDLVGRGAGYANRNVNEPYEVNPNAERVANGVAGFILVFSIIVGTICIILGIVLASDYMPQAGIPLVGAGVILILLGIVAWASIKLFVNISRSLYNINDSIQRLHTLVEQKK